MLETALHFSHTLLKEIIEPGDTVIDATMGNGFDTIFLAQLVGETGFVHAFDIQKQAIEETSKKINEWSLNKQTHLYHQGHETLEQVLSHNTCVKAAVFNLGYLPKSNKQMITTPTTTIQALEAILKILVNQGRIVLVVYHGHIGGETELLAVKQFCEDLPQTRYTVLTYQFVNQQNNPPVLLCIEKK